MKLNKTVAKTMVFALGLGAFSLLGGYTAKATTATAPAKPALEKVKLDPTIEALAVDDSIKDNAKYWGVAKELKSEKGANLTIGTAHYAVSEINPVLGKTIDLSSFNKGRKIFIAVGAEEVVKPATWDVKVIEPESKEFAVEYLPLKTSTSKKIKDITKDNITNKGLGNDEVGYIVATATKDGAALALSGATLEAIEVQEGEGSWATVKAGLGADNDAIVKKLKSYTATGKTLKFRYKAEGKWNTNVATVKISPLPNAPTVKFDTAKGTTNLKSTMRVKVTYTGNTADVAYKDATDKMTFKDLEVYTATNGLELKGGTIAVKTKATDKKLASKEVIYTIEKQTAPTVTDTSDVPKNDGVIADKVSVALKVLYDLKKGAVLTNSSDVNYEYFISYTGAEPNENTKWKKLAKQKTKGKTKTPTNVSLKYSASEKDDTYGGDGTKIFFRVAGEKQNGNVVTLASPAVGKKLKFQNISQVFTASGDNTSGVATNLTVKKATAKTHKIDFTLTNLQKKKSSPKLKITQKVNGVSLKADKFVTSEANDKSSVTLKFSKSAFKAAGTHKLVFTISAEGATKEHTVNLTIED